MLHRGPRWAFIFTHIPTGVSVTVDEYSQRSQFKARQVGLKLLQSKVWAAQNGVLPSEEIVRSYILDEEIDIQDFDTYRQREEKVE